MSNPPKLLAVSDLHIKFRGNEKILDLLRADNPQDWLIVAGDVSERIDDVVDTLTELKTRFAQVIWVPGNHELYTTVKDSYQLFGLSRYDYLVQRLRERGIITPEDEYPFFELPTGVWRIVPLFTFYDYSFRPASLENISPLQALAKAREVNVVATDEALLSCDPYPNKPTWCRARVQYSRDRLDTLDPQEKTVLINHWPLRKEPCDFLFDQEFALWCGTTETQDWHTRYRATHCVYGHLHIPRTTWYDGVRFDEVSIGYPREWMNRGLAEPPMRQILPDTGETQYDVGDLGLRFTFDPQRARRAKQEHDKRREQIRARSAARGTHRD